MNMQQLKQFISIAKTGNITKAAKELYISQQALSQSIQNLEKELGTLLFERTVNGVELTEIGVKILPQSQYLLEEYERYTHFLKKELAASQKTFTVLVNPVTLLPSVPSEIILDNANANINMRVEPNFDVCLKYLSSGEVDVVYCYKPDDLNGFSYIPVISEPPVVLLNKEHPLAAKSELTIRDLRNETILMPTGLTKFKMDLFKAYAREGEYLYISFETPSISLLFDLVRSNKGIKFSPAFIPPNYITNNIEIRPLNASGLIVEVGFLVKNYGDLPSGEKQFIMSVLHHYKRDFTELSMGKPGGQ